MRGLTDETLNLAGGRFVLAIRNRQTLDSERKGSDDMIKAEVETTRDGKWLVLKFNENQTSSLNLSLLDKESIKKIIKALQEEIENESNL